MADVEETRLDRIYAAPRERFVSERDAVAKELRAEGKPDEAATVAALRKPTLVAWALNEVSRSRSDDVRRLIEAQDGMHKTKSADSMRELSQERQEIMGDLTAAAVTVLEEAGHAGQEAGDKIALTLLALGTNAEAADRFRKGRLHQEVAPGDMWDLPVATPKTGPAEADPLIAGTRQVERARKDLLTLQEKAKKLEERSDQAARRLEQARQQAEEAARAAADARTEADRSARELVTAERRLKKRTGGK
ncbi:MAG: hypothetical protein ACRDVD_05660 [Acidimicrobiia bacterium]